MRAFTCVASIVGLMLTVEHFMLKVKMCTFSVGLNFGSFAQASSNKTFMFAEDDCYSYYAKSAGKFCKENENWFDICDGTPDDCAKKGQILCNKDPTCFGIQIHDGLVSISCKILFQL